MCVLAAIKTRCAICANVQFRLDVASRTMPPTTCYLTAAPCVHLCNPPWQALAISDLLAMCAFVQSASRQVAIAMVKLYSYGCVAT